MNALQLAGGILVSAGALYVEIAFYLMLGFTLAGLLYGIVPEQAVRKHLGKNNLASSVKSALFGVPLPLCSCGVLPAAFSLRKQGASQSATTSFLISTPQTGVDSILVTYAFLGPVFAVFRPIAALISGVLGGVMVNILGHPTTQQAGSSNPTSTAPPLPRSWHLRIWAMFRYAYYEFPNGIARWMVLGLFLAGVISYFVPDDFFTRYLNSELVSMLLFLVVGIPLYTCSTGSVPIAAVLLSKGLSPGAVFVFLVVGPVTSIASLTLILRLLGKRIALVYLGVIVCTSLFFGLILNRFFATMQIPVPRHFAHHSHVTAWDILWAVALGMILLHIFYRQFLNWRKTRQEVIVTEAKTTTLKVEGMTCQHCVQNVTNAILAVQPHAEVAVDLKSGQCRISGVEKLSPDALKAVAAKGYNAKVID